MAKRTSSDLSDTRHNLSFAGCGFLGLYHVGVCACLRKFAPQLYLNRPVSGTSAGSIAAVCLICDVNMADCVQYMCQLIANARKYTIGPFDPRFRISEHLKEGLSRLLPSDAHLMSSGRLFISLTNFNTGKNVVVNQYKDRDELISAIMCSAHIPVFSGFLPMTFRGQPVVDGGLSDNLLDMNQFTIKVSPFSGDADICPLDAPWGPTYHTDVPQRYEDILGSITFCNNTIRVNTTNIKRIFNMVWPMNSDQLVSLAVQGYHDAIRFLTTRGFIACQLHRTRRRFSTLSNERKFSTGTCGTGHRIRRSNGQNSPTSASSHTTDDLKTQSAGDSGFNDLPKSPRLPRCSTPTAPLHGSGTGFNVARCVHCQEDLRKALGSVFPNFLRTIIHESSVSKSASQTTSVSVPRKLLSLSFALIKNGVCSCQLKMLGLCCQLVSVPLNLQLDLIIYVLSRSKYIGRTVRDLYTRASVHIPQWLTSNSSDIPISAITKQLQETGHIVDPTGAFRVIYRARNKLAKKRLLAFAEAVAIHKGSRNLYKQKQIMVNLSRCISLADRYKLTNIHLKILLHIFIEAKKLLYVLNSITNPESGLSSIENDHAYCGTMSPDSLSSQTSMFFPTSTLKHRKPETLADLIHSLIDSYSGLLMDMIFGMNKVKLPSALDCGLELFSPCPEGWSNKLTLPSNYDQDKQDESDLSTTESIK